MNILQLSDLSKLFIATYMFKHLNSNNIPITLSHHYSTRNKHTLNTPRHNLTIYGQSLMYKGHTVWNSVPQYVKECNSTSSFKGESYNIPWKIPFFFLPWGVGDFRATSSSRVAQKAMLIYGLSTRLPTCILAIVC